ncbi:MAG: hypothetical protein Q8R86_00880 [Sulfuricurvum sp.]|nr:hypothetical protein [Sulfuricurvum sp.]
MIQARFHVAAKKKYDHMKSSTTQSTPSGEIMIQARFHLTKKIKL